MSPYHCYLAWTSNQTSPWTHPHHRPCLQQQLAPIEETICSSGTACAFGIKKWSWLSRKRNEEMAKQRATLLLFWFCNTQRAVSVTVCVVLIANVYVIIRLFCFDFVFCSSGYEGAKWERHTFVVGLFVCFCLFVEFSRAFAWTWQFHFELSQVFSVLVGNWRALARKK